MKGESLGLYKILKIIIIIISLSSTVFLSGCEEQTVFNGKVESYNELTDKIDLIIASIGAENVAELPFAKEFEQLDPQARAETALYLAESMAIAQMFDLTTDEIIVLSGNAVKAFPHPLLLNNYAALVLENGHVDDALYFLLLALNQQPDHPILLTNIANLYMELEDLAAAEVYATKALQTGGEFGPAYQVMTTVHLSKGNGELAAETMIKSARHVFNDVTIHHFESFLGAVNQLDPVKDDYPLDEVYLDELYEIAKSNVDTGDMNEGVDTPAGQLNIKPFPTFGSPEHLEKSKHFLIEEISKLEGAESEALSEYLSYDSYSDYSEIEGDGIFPFEYNVRQKYAYKVLESYYTFKLKKLLAQYEQLEEKIRYERADRYDVLGKNFDSNIEAHTRNKPALTEEAVREYHIKRYEIELNWRKAQYDVMKQDASTLLAESQRIYNESKQMLEEYWLKSGGLLKYIVDEELFGELNAKRKQIVYSNLITQFRNLEHISTSLSLAKLEIPILEMTIAKLSDDSDADPEEEEFDVQEQDLQPEIEDGRELDVFPEPGTIHNIQFGFEEGFFGNDASISGNNKSYEASIDTLFGAKVWDGNWRGGTDRSYTLHGVKAVGETTWYTNTTMVQNFLAEGFGKTARDLGKSIGFGYISSDRSGPYNVKRARSNTVIDRGTIHVQESGWTIGPVSKSSKTERTVSSSMLGIGSTKNIVKYKFGPLTMSYEQR